jgi:thiol:disulfide interchange protein DsbD
VKSVFGVALLAAALVFLKDAVPGARALFSAAGWVGFAAAGAAALGVLLGALHGDFHGTSLRTTAKGLGVALVVGGLAYGVGAAGARERLRSMAGLTWHDDEVSALSRAKAEGRPVILDFWADWCVACKELDRIAWADPRVREAAARFVAVKADGTEDSPAFQALLEKYGIVGMPTVIFIDARGREVPVRVTSTIEPKAMVELLERVDGACDAPRPARPGVALATCTRRW